MWLVHSEFEYSVYIHNYIINLKFRQPWERFLNDR